jgi:ABC-type multidrug transport system fused ATPase/permease subunit
MDSLNNLLTTLPEIEQELISAERVLEYCDLPPEEPMGDRDDVHIFKNPMHEKGSNSHKLLGDGYAEGNVEFVSSHGVSETDTNNGWNDSSTTRYARLEEGPREAQDCTGEGEAWRDWPRSSVVEMQNVYLQYGPHQPYALKDVNVRIEEGSRVAIIGRTGSGKSSLLRAILRMSAFKGGVILGGLDTKALPLSVLRKQLVVLPQAAALFTGSVRMNLDPANVYTDDQVARALADCGVIETMRRNDGTSSPISDGVEAKELLVSVAESVKLLTREERLAKARDLLSMQVKDAGNDLSYGQRQLLSLARSLLRLQSTAKVGAGAGHQAGVSRIMIIDEATAAVDAYSEAMLRIVLRNLFGMESQSPHDNQTDNVDALEADLRRRTTLLMICHKEDGIRTLCNHELKMNDGSVEYFKQI